MSNFYVSASVELHELNSGMTFQEYCRREIMNDDPKENCTKDCNKCPYEKVIRHAMKIMEEGLDAQSIGACYIEEANGKVRDARKIVYEITNAEARIFLSRKKTPAPERDSCEVCGSTCAVVETQMGARCPEHYGQERDA